MLAASTAICEAIDRRALLAFDYHGEPRVVVPYVHGTSTRGVEVLRAVQLRRPRSVSSSGGFGFGKLWLVADMQHARILSEPFTPDDPSYNPDDAAMAEIHCRVPPDAVTRADESGARLAVPRPGS